jgi:hypothetical protein
MAGKPVVSSPATKEVTVELLEQDVRARQAGSVVAPIPAGDEDERIARRALRAQIVKLERELSDAFLTAAPMGGLEPSPSSAAAHGRLLDLGELEAVRDELVQRLAAARTTIAERAQAQEEARVYLERVLLEPGKHRFVRIARAELGEPGCGVWQVRPRLGLIGMLMGWWQVKLSSGCPLSGGHALTACGPSRV